MIKNLKLLAFITALIVNQSIFSQITYGKNGTFSNKWYSGTLVLKNKDTLNGVVKFENSSTTKDLIGLRGVGGTNKIFFKKTKKSKKKLKFKKEAVDYFIVKTNSGEVAKYTFVPTNKNNLKLMQVLIEGKITLYLKIGYQNLYLGDTVNPGKANVIQQHEKKLYYVKRLGENFADDIFFTYGLKSFKKVASKYFSDCKSLAGKISNGEYKSSELSKIIKEYNNCTTKND